MGDAGTRVKINLPHVMSEVIDGEVIAINLVSGNYYSITGAGTAAWATLTDAGPLSVAELVEALERRYDAEPEEISAAVEVLVAQLETEGLVTASGPGDNPRAPAHDDVGTKESFVAPGFETYTDMQDLVLLDPVHQVGEAGWPQPRPDTVREAPSIG